MLLPVTLRQRDNSCVLLFGTFSTSECGGAENANSHLLTAHAFTLLAPPAAPTHPQRPQLSNHNFTKYDIRRHPCKGKRSAPKDSY